MHIAKEMVPVKISAPGGSARQQQSFSDATGYGTMSGEHFSLSAGLDISPLLRGLEDDLSRSPHWGYVVEGRLTISYADRTQEVTSARDSFCWPPGHTIRVEENADLILLSPRNEHTCVMEHVVSKMGGAAPSPIN